jgi:F-type H+-transporting ATPase subunit beta
VPKRSSRRAETKEREDGESQKTNGTGAGSGANGSNIGQVIQVIGPTVDVRFDPERLPPINNALTISDPDRNIHLTVEVGLHIGDEVVRCVAMSSTDGLVRGMEAVDTGAPISVPVGRQTLGRVFNLLGEPIDQGAPVSNPEQRLPIHRAPPSFEEQETVARIFETGIKVVDLLAPYAKGGKIGPLRRRGSRQDGHSSRVDP